MSNLIIPSDSIVISKQCLGGGASGTVYKAIYANEIVAVKTLITSSKDFQKEATTLSSLNHPRIVRCLGILLPTSIVLEYLHLGSLHAFLYNPRENTGGVVHAKIGDFGLAVVKKTDLTITSGDAGKGTLVWMAPELHDLRGCDPSRSSPPPPDRQTRDPETILDDDCPPALSRLVEKCVNMDAESRPRITEVVKAFEVLMENVTVPSAKQMGIVTSIIDSDFMSGQSRGDSRLLLPQTTTFDVSATAFHSNPRNHSSGSTYVAIHSRRNRNLLPSKRRDRRFHRQPFINQETPAIMQRPTTASDNYGRF
ncbi:kinase-like domain-containing protein [Chytridium lagenaria]|nr:kinase-like domain-containing protein [Chytridium lagenaria]